MQPDGLPFSEIDLATLGGLAVVVAGVIAGAKRLWKSIVKGREPLLAVVLSYALGIATKVTVPGAYPGLSWVGCIVAFFFVAILAQQLHDKVENPLKQALANRRATKLPNDMPRLEPPDQPKEGSL